MSKHWTETFFTEDYRRVGLEERRVFGPAEAGLVKKALGLRRGARVLDLGCGIGRHAAPLAQLGLDVTGLDLTAAYLQRARAQARRAGVKVRFLLGDMRQLAFKEEFDAVINLFTSFGYYDDETNRHIFIGIAGALKPRGRCLLEVMNRDYMLKTFQKWQVTETKRGLVLVDNEFDSATSRVTTHWRLIQGDRVRDMGGFDLRCYARHELADLVESAGLTLTAAYGSLLLEPFTVESRRLVLVARKDPA